MKKLVLVLLMAVSMSFALKVVGEVSNSAHYDGNIRLYGPSLFRLVNDGKSEINGFKIYYYTSTLLRNIDYAYRKPFFVTGSRGLAADAKISYELMPESPNWLRVVFDYPTRKIPVGDVHPTDGYYLYFEFGEIDKRIVGKYYGVIKRNPRESLLDNIVVESADGKVLYGKHPENNRRVGVISSNLGCYSGMEVDITLDTEDSKCRTGFSGGVTPSAFFLNKGNVEMRFCAVEYDELPRATFDYFVLKLDAKCPKNSYPFRRYHDTEDNNNKNSVWGNIRAWPNDVSKNATMEYCFVPSDSKSKIDFPFKEQFGVLSKDYGVFAKYLSLQTMGYELYIDDEDSKNANSWYWYDTPKSIQDRIKKIAYGSDNTTYNIVTYYPMSAAVRKVAGVGNEVATEPVDVKPVSAQVKSLDRSFVGVELKSAGSVKISVLNTKGAVVAKVVGENLQPGFHNLGWNSTNVPSGSYMVVAKQNGLMNVAKIFLK